MATLMTNMTYTEANYYYTATYSDPMEMPVMELMGNSYGAVAARKLYHLTGDSTYQGYERDFLNVLLRMTQWFEDQTDSVSLDLRNLGLFYPFVGATCPTAWETAEANLCLAWLLKYDRTNARAPLLALLSNLNRIDSFYFYPATFTPTVRNLNPGIRQDIGQYFPTENLYMLENPTGSGVSPSGTAVYMSGLGLWNAWLYEDLAAASNRNVLVLNLASLDGYEESLRSACREFLVCNPTTSTLTTTINHQALDAGAYQVTFTDATGAVLSTTNYTQSQLAAGHPVTLTNQQIVYLKIENTNSIALFTNICSYRNAGEELSYAYQLLQVKARDGGINAAVIALQNQFASAMASYGSGNYGAAYTQANQIVTTCLYPNFNLTIGLPSGGTNGFPITWGSYSNKFYSVQETTDLRVGFTNLVQHIPATPPENTCLVVSTNRGTRFYRVMME